MILALVAANCTELRLIAVDSPPIIGPAATKAEVIKAYGMLRGISQVGTREILTYPQGQISLVNGRVEKVDFPTKNPVGATLPSPAPAPGASSVARSLPNPNSSPIENASSYPKEKAEREATGKAATTVANGSAAWVFWVVLKALGVGLVISGVMWWWLWRPRKGGETGVRPNMKERIAFAASGMPTPVEIAGWPKRILCAVVAGLAEADGYLVSERAGGRDGDMALRRETDGRPAVIVNCLPGVDGVASMKHVRELHAIVLGDRIERAWLVAPMGFSHEARDYARERQLVLIDSEQLLAQMREVPPILWKEIAARME
ncbi:MAG: restriction endonuclease [Opitutaceae bacterium]